PAGWTRTTSSWRRAARSTYGANSPNTSNACGQRAVPPSPTSWSGATRRRQPVMARRRFPTS
ncbi:uncharacterized protein METZ01_LOCUS480441, partial [marine metagenome]